MEKAAGTPLQVRPKTEARLRLRPATIASYVALCVLGGLFLMPFVWALSASFKTNAEIYRFPPSVIPRPPHPENYRIALGVLPFWQFAVNSLVITLACVAGQLLSGSVVAYSAYVWLLANAPLSLVTTYAYVNPAVAVLLGALLLGEPLTLSVLVGGAVIIAAVALVISTESRSRRPVGGTRERSAPLEPA